jgi:hypothetical protein
MVASNRLSESGTPRNPAIAPLPPVARGSANATKAVSKVGDDARGPWRPNTFDFCWIDTDTVLRSIDADDDVAAGGGPWKQLIIDTFFMSNSNPTAAES